MLTDEVLASLLMVGNCSVLDPPAVVPADISDIAGRLRMTTRGRQRIDAGFKNRPMAGSN